MRLTFDKHPVTLILCMIWSTITFFFVILDINNFLRIILSIPVIIFIPGHVLIGVLFPTKKTDKGIDFTDRIALSLGISIAIVPLFGIVLNYTPWGIKLQPIILSLEAFILIIGSIAIIRWFRTPPSNRFILSINISLPKHENKLDKTITVILVITAIIALSLFTYIIITPKEVEKFTEFYYTGSNNQTNEYPQDLTIGENTSINIGIVNHEYKTINYTIEVWLVNQTTYNNTILNKNETIYHNIWFMEKINVTLNHKPINLEENWGPQWEYNYTFNITKKGYLKLVFLLYTTLTPNYITNNDYKETEINKINTENTDAYRSVYLWINVV